MRSNKTLKLLPAVLALALTLPVATPNRATAAPTARIQYSKSKDGRYIYIRSAAQLEAFNPEQVQALGVAFERIKAQISDLKKTSPRNTPNPEITEQAIKGATAFDQSIDGIVNYMQKYYGEIDTLRNYVNLGTPTALVAFLGVNWAKTPGWSPVKVTTGGSVVMGAVFVPQRVRRVEVDTGKIDEYWDFDSNLVFWPTGNLGLALGNNTSVTAPQPTTPAPTGAAASADPTAEVAGLLGGNQRFGVGLIWGRLDQASDFSGMVTGASIAVSALGQRLNFKPQVLTNFSRKQAVSNVFVTAALERGAPPASLEIRGSVGWVIDAAGFLGASSAKTGSPEEALANAAARAVDKAAATSGSSPGPGPGGIINPQPINPGPTLIQ